MQVQAAKDSGNALWSARLFGSRAAVLKARAAFAGPPGGLTLAISGLPVKQARCVGRKRKAPRVGAPEKSPLRGF